MKKLSNLKIPCRRRVILLFENTNCFKKTIFALKVLYVPTPIGDRNRKVFLKEANSIFQCMFENSYIPPKQCQKSGQNHSI